MLTHFRHNASFLYALKMSEGQKFSDVFSGYRTEVLAWNLGQTNC